MTYQYFCNDRTIVKSPRCRKAGLSREVIISRYAEDLDWVENIPTEIEQITVYNKGEELSPFADKRIRVVSLPNVGREAHTWLHHWCVHRETLADVTFTLQGSPLAHSPDLFELLTKDFSSPSTLTRHYTPGWPSQLITDSTDRYEKIDGITVRYW